MVLSMKLDSVVKGALFLAWLLSFMQAPAQTSSRTEKRIQKALVETYPLQSPQWIPLAISIERKQELQLALRDEVRLVRSGEETVGIMVLTASKGRTEYFDYLVLYDTSLQILALDVLEYRSDHGYEIMNKGWLRSFTGKTGCDLEYGRDIDAISGATLSAGSLTRDIGKWCRALHTLREDHAF